MIRKPFFEGECNERLGKIDGSCIYTIVPRPCPSMVLGVVWCVPLCTVDAKRGLDGVPDALAQDTAYPRHVCILK